ncbi:MAG: hypothetical protein HZY76_11265 [Anaerolineae bacterium]|nr:MAG: hypothetical protein HZY76_11265 [Anaerolineae bacterium]
MVAEFDAALAAVMDAPGIILDLRGNGGGSTAIATPSPGVSSTAPSPTATIGSAPGCPSAAGASFDYRVTRAGPPTPAR